MSEPVEQPEVASGLESGLRDYYQHARPDLSLSVEGFQRLAAGWECEVFAFDLRDASPAGVGDVQRLVLRLYVGPEARDKAGREFAIMRYVRSLGLPVPLVHHLELDSAPLGRPFVVMERVEGEPYSLVVHRAPYPRRRELLARFMRCLVDLHAADWRPFAPEVVGREDSLLGGFLDEMERIVERANIREARTAIAWLRAHAAEVGASRPAIVHLDYHMRNLLIRPDDSIAVLDWTQGQVQDFRVDLGWTLLLAGLYDGWAMREALLGEYRRQAGWPVEAVEYFEVLAAVRRLYSMLMVLGGGGAKIGLDPRAPDQIRANLGHLAAVYALFLGRTGIAVPAAERVLATWDGGQP